MTFGGHFSELPAHPRHVSPAADTLSAQFFARPPWKTRGCGTVSSWRPSRARPAIWACAATSSSRWTISSG